MSKRLNKLIWHDQRFVDSVGHWNCAENCNFHIWRSWEIISSASLYLVKEILDKAKVLWFKFYQTLRSFQVNQKTILLITTKGKVVFLSNFITTIEFEWSDCKQINRWDIFLGKIFYPRFLILPVKPNPAWKILEKVEDVRENLICVSNMEVTPFF